MLRKNALHASYAREAIMWLDFTPVRWERVERVTREARLLVIDEHRPPEDPVRVAWTDLHDTVVSVRRDEAVNLPTAAFVAPMRARLAQLVEVVHAA